MLIDFEYIKFLITFAQLLNIKRYDYECKI